MDLDGAVTELYGLHPDEFMSARGALVRQAKEDGDAALAKAVGAVRKPTAAAWAVNQLVRHRPTEIEQLLELASSLQQASEQRDGAALRDLGRRRTSLVDQLLQAGREVVADGGGTLSGPVAEQVRETLVAALASPAAAEATASGRLTRSLSYAGFGDVDLAEATASPLPSRRPALRVLQGEKETGSSREADGSSSLESPEDSSNDDVASGPDPALVERLERARSRTRVTTAEAADAGARLHEATEALTTLDARIAELEDDLRTTRAARDALVVAKAEAAAADKTAQRTLRASFAELDAAQALLPDE